MASKSHGDLTAAGASDGEALTSGSPGSTSRYLRYSLHIPNAYPRVTSPKPSPRGSPISSPQLQAVDVLDSDNATQQDSNKLTADGADPGASSISAPAPLAGLDEIPTAHPRHTDHTSGPITLTDVKKYFTATHTTGESARDFLARERTFFSWLRLSILLAIAAAVFYLRLQIKDVTGLSKGGSNGGGGSSRNAYAAQIQSQIPMQALHSRLYAPFNRKLPSSSKSLLDTNIALSQAIGVVFFVLAIIALVVGFVDYMRCARALEYADQVVPSASLHRDDNHPTNVERRAVAQKWHDVRHAKQAHSHVAVQIVEIIIAVVIFVVAVIILITAQLE